jgi:hypothetical protein
MSESHTGPTDPLGRSDGPGHADPERVAEDLVLLAEVVETGIEIDGQVTQIATSTWAIYGHSSYDGEVIVGEYQDVEEATEVLLEAPRPDPEPRLDAP